MLTIAAETCLFDTMTIKITPCILTCAGWTRVMRGIAQNDIAKYSTSAGALNWPADNKASTADASGKTWKLSDADINMVCPQLHSRDYSC